MPRPRSAGAAASNSRPLAYIAAAAPAGVATRLVRRVEVRVAAMAPSTAAASTAGATPYNASSMNTSTSPTTMECLLSGKRTGNAAASATVAVQANTCNTSAAGRCATCTPAATTAAPPASARASQKRVAALL